MSGGGSWLDMYFASRTHVATHKCLTRAATTPALPGVGPEQKKIKSYDVKLTDVQHSGPEEGDAQNSH